MLSSAIAPEVKTFIEKLPPTNKAITTYVSRYSSTGTFPSRMRLALVKIWNAIKSIFVDTDEKAAKKSLSGSLHALRCHAISLDDSKVDEIVNLTLAHLIGLNSIPNNTSRVFLTSFVKIIEKCELYNISDLCNNELKKDLRRAYSNKEIDQNALCDDVEHKHFHRLTITFSKDKETINYISSRHLILNERTAT